MTVRTIGSVTMTVRTIGSVTMTGKRVQYKFNWTTVLKIHFVPHSKHIYSQRLKFSYDGGPCRRFRETCRLHSNRLSFKIC